MTHSNACTQFVAGFEGLRTTAYRDQRGIWTIGYGHTANVKEGDTCTPEQALTMLSLDLMTADAAVKAAIAPTLSQNEFDACVSLAYNIGGGAFLHSTVAKLINALDFPGAAEAFLMWDKTNGAVNPGLLRRRQAERALFLTVPQ